MTSTLQSAANVARPPGALQAGPQPRMRYLARQPILRATENICGYELLFRDGSGNHFPGADPDSATCNVIDFFLLYGRGELTGGRPAFINCTRNVLLSEVITLLPPALVVVEVLEDVPADSEVLAACKRLHRAGYKIALDDFPATPSSLRLLPYADVVKVDFLATGEAELRDIAADARQRGIRLLAEKVETYDQLILAQSLGFDYFQGYYFSRPESLTMRDASRCTAQDALEMLRLCVREPYNVEQLEQALLCQPGLCYRLLRSLELASFELSTIRSLRHALSLLGRHALGGILRKLLQLALCREHDAWQALPAIDRTGPRSEASLPEMAHRAGNWRGIWDQNCGTNHGEAESRSGGPFKH